MQYIEILDYLLLPLYLVGFYWLVKRMSVKIADPLLRRILITGFILHLAGTIAYSLILQYYYGYGDSFTYYVGSSFFHDQILEDPSNLRYLFAGSEEVKRWYDMSVGSIDYSGYFGLTSSVTVMKISAVLSFLCFNKFLIISLFFGFFSFLGQWKLFNVFIDIDKSRNTRILAIAVLYTPSICFWGSGLMKDSLCLGALGLIFHGLYNIFVRKKGRKRDWLFIGLLIFMIFLIKSYILYIGMASLLTVVLIRYVFLIKNLLLRFFVSTLFVFLVGLVAAFSDIDRVIKEIINDSYSQVEQYKNNYENVNEIDENSRGSISLSDVNPTLGGLLIKSPEVIFTCLYRPFLWESRKVIIFFSSLESTLLLLATLYLLFRTKVRGFFSSIFSDGFLLFCFVLSILFALIIGFTTFNFGTMARYKIIFLPFFYFMLVSIYGRLPHKKQVQTQVAA